MGNGFENGLRKIHILKRGVDIDIRSGQLSPEQVEAKMKLVALAGTLKRRFPDRGAGTSFMEHVDPKWGGTLRSYATELTGDIATAWNDISPNKQTAVVLFGSIARGLVKNPATCDPSNIDLTVIGNITDDERNQLFDSIRPSRESTQAKILENCPNVDTHEHNPGNAGVHIQNIDILTRNGYHSALYWYIASSAYALYDPANIWGQLESDALNDYISTKKKKGPTEYVVYQEASDSATQAHL